MAKSKGTSVITDLNKLAGRYLSDKCLEIYGKAPMLSKKEDKVLGVTFLDESMDATLLESPHELEALPEKVLRNAPKRAIYRGRISYASALRIQKDQVHFMMLMGRRLDAAYRALSDRGIDLDKYEVSMQIPGAPGRFFLECENVAGYEFRVVITRKA